MNMNQATQKALIQLAKNLIITALMTGFAAIEPVLIQSGPIAKRQALIVFAIAFTFSIVHGLTTYLEAYNPALARVIDADVSAIEKKVEVNALSVSATTTEAQPLQGPVAVQQSTAVTAPQEIK